MYNLIWPFGTEVSGRNCYLFRIAQQVYGFQLFNSLEVLEDWEVGQIIGGN